MAEHPDCARAADAMGELVEGTVDAATRASLDAHLQACDACRALARDLVAIRRAAGTLDRLAPPERAWSSLAARLDSELARAAATPVRAAGRTWLAAAAAIALLAGSAFLFVGRDAVWRRSPAGPGSATGPGAAPDNPGAAALVESIEMDLQLAEQHYDKAIRGLEQIAGAQETLDAEVAATLRRNLAVIDRAIEESRAALRSQPGSQLARESLFEALRRKVALLQDTIALVNEMRKGNQAGAAAIAEGLTKS